MKKVFTCLFFAGFVGITSCKKNMDDAAAQPVITVNKIAPDGFNFNTMKNIALNVTLKSADGSPLSGVLVSIYDPGNKSTDAAIFKGVTDLSGNLSGQVSVSASLTKIIIDPAYLGLLHNAQAAINNNAVTVTIGGPNVYGGDIIPETVTVQTVGSFNAVVLGGTTSIVFSYPAPYLNTADAVVNTTTYPLALGRPQYLDLVPDVIDASLIKYLNASLPESKPLTTTHPNYILAGAPSSIDVLTKTDVSITFVSEGAGNLNGLAYYTYPTGTPPLVETDIKQAMLVFPNASGLGSGGSLKSGDKVKIGTFDAGTSIGFILMASGWTGSGVNINGTKYYSDASLNPEADANLKKHVVFLYDDVHKVTLIGFEDINRTAVSCDNDFNDLVVYASSSVVNALAYVSEPVVDKALDSDGDGVIDVLDAFPNDAARAYISYFPSATGFASIAFEDNWPSKGDYDMNDLVVKYRYTFVTNAQNKVLTIQGDYSIAAIGANYKNGFGVQLPCSAAAVQSVTGQKLKDNYIQLSANGVESGQLKAVIIPFDNGDALISNADGSSLVNTLTVKDKAVSTTATVLVTLVTPISQSSLAASLFNPFLISNERRGYEIHLAGYVPTDKADINLFATGDDASIPASGKFYISKENWPWAICFNDQFTYPLETVSITSGYPHFADWAASGGVLFTDWYSTLTTGYRTSVNLYLK